MTAVSKQGRKINARRATPQRSASLATLRSYNVGRAELLKKSNAERRNGEGSSRGIESHRVKCAEGQTTKGKGPIGSKEPET